LRGQCIATTDAQRWPATRRSTPARGFWRWTSKPSCCPEHGEYALNHLLDHEIDLSGFDERFSNDDIGASASAYPPAMLLKVVSSRGIERACREHVAFIALSGDICPHFTTIASLVSGLGDLIGKVFQQVLLICDAQGLIGREMFAPAIRLRRRNLQCGRSTRLAPWQAVRAGRMSAVPGAEMALPTLSRPSIVEMGLLGAALREARNS